jgi:hypothetical protein
MFGYGFALDAAHLRLKRWRIAEKQNECRENNRSIDAERLHGYSP